ncbi:uncharacterized protein LOC117645106 [Thrips palmi]|uniref:Uncharacterized protein LOC117645106 n=1 Tax=Thrips palmi TaxID=161013 RepID=A0A6P8YTV6_THRPL|nr:uncharacterized protein LOC117645106 [Thrips palmi]
MPVRQGPRCRVVGCINQKKCAAPGTSLFVVPKHAATFEKWLQLTGNPELLDLPIHFLGNNMRFCEKHFLPEQVCTKSKFKLLKRGVSGPAVPTQFHEGHIPISDELMQKWRLTEQYRALRNPPASQERKKSNNVHIRILQEDFITNEGGQPTASESSSNESSADGAVQAACSPEKTESNVIIHILQEDDISNEEGGQSLASQFFSNESTTDGAFHAAVSPKENDVIIRILQEDYITDEEEQSMISEFSSNEPSANTAISPNEKAEGVNHTVQEDYIINQEESESRTLESSSIEPSEDGTIHTASGIKETEPFQPTVENVCINNEEGSQSRPSESSLTTSSVGSNEWEPHYILVQVGDQLMAVPGLSIEIPGMK